MNFNGIKIRRVSRTMVFEKIPEKIDHELRADRWHAQILMEVANSPISFKEAKKIIEELGIHIIETKRLSANWTLIKLDLKDMRDVTLKLSESGFLNIKGVNAIENF